MATMHIRNIDDQVKERLRIRAALHGRSMEAEVRTLIEEAVKPGEPREHLYFRARRLVEKYGPLDIELPPREVEREPPDFS